MKKIVSLFKRNYDGDRLVVDEVVPDAEWVVKGEGVATQKFDGTCCLVKDGRLYRRFDCVQGRTPPAGFMAAQEPDPVTGHWPGWVLVDDGHENVWHREALAVSGALEDGTYELCGPKIQGNPEGLTAHVLIPHGKVLLPDAPRDFAGLKAWLEPRSIEGIVWHHPDGRMVKIKRRDFFKPAKKKRYES